MHVLPEAVTVLGVGHEILGEQSQRLVLVAEREARGRYVAEQLPLGVEVRVPGRAIQHAPRAVGESGAPEDEPHPHLLVQPPERAVALGREPHHRIGELPSQLDVGVRRLRGHQHQLALDEQRIRRKAAAPLVTPVGRRQEQLEIVRRHEQAPQDRVRGREIDVSLVRAQRGAVRLGEIARLVVEDREDVPRPDLLRVQAGRFFQIRPGCGEELVGGRRVRLESLGEPEISDGATYFERIGVVRFLLNRPIGVPKAEAEPRLNLAWLALEPGPLVRYAGPLHDRRQPRPVGVFG